MAFGRSSPDLDANRTHYNVDDFTQLNEKFIKARRDYEALLESSMSHPPQPSYHQYAPQPPQGYGAGGPAGYQPPQGAPQQEPPRFYAAAPHQGKKDPVFLRRR